jgi:drug/metabolite transporter (DMT)-like permease
MIWILSAIVLWSSIGVVIRFSGMPVALLIFSAASISTVLLSLYFMYCGQRCRLPRGRALVLLLVLGPVSLVNTFTFFYAYQTTSVANAVLTHYTAPIFVALFAPLFLKEQTTPRIIVAVALASLGLWIMLGISGDQFIALALSGDRSTIGILSGLCSGVAYAALVIILRKMAASYTPLVITLAQNSVVALLLLPVVSVPDNLLSGLWSLVFMGVVHSTIAPLLYVRGMRTVPASTAAILGYLEPVCVILLGTFLLAEPVTPATLGGGALILISGYLTIRPADRGTGPTVQ